MNAAQNEIDQESDDVPWYHILHKWTRWGDPGKIYPSALMWQWRTCRVCGRVQERAL